jgi:hypothetical protein
VTIAGTAEGRGLEGPVNGRTALDMLRHRDDRQKRWSHPVVFDMVRVHTCGRATGYARITPRSEMAGACQRRFDVFAQTLNGRVTHRALCGVVPPTRLLAQQVYMNTT